MLTTYEGGDRAHTFKCCKNVFSSSTFPTLMGRLGWNGLVHVRVQWELSGRFYEGLFRARKDCQVGSGMGRHKPYMPTQTVCSSLPTSVQPLSPETCHPSLYNQSFPLYHQLCIHSTIRMFYDTYLTRCVSCTCMCVSLGDLRMFASHIT